MSLLDVDEFSMVSSDFPEDGEVVVVSEMASLDVSLVKPIMVPDFIAPESFDVGVLQLPHQSLFGVALDLGEVVSFSGINDNNFVSHFFRI